MSIGGLFYFFIFRKKKKGSIRKELLVTLVPILYIPVPTYIAGLLANNSITLVRLRTLSHSLVCNLDFPARAFGGGTEKYLRTYHLMIVDNVGREE